MGCITPIILALLLNCTGTYIFSTPKKFDHLPYVSYVIFLTSTALLLCNVNFKPRVYRNLFPWANFIVEFLVVMFLMEFIAYNFWFPLETAITAFLIRFPEFAEDTLKRVGFTCKEFCASLEILKLKETLLFVSYLLSIFIFLCIIQATQVLDFAILVGSGVTKFIEHIAVQCQKLYRNIVSTIILTSTSTETKPTCFDVNYYGQFRFGAENIESNDGDRYINSLHYT